MAKIGERSLNSVAAPRWIFAGQLECEIDDLWRDSGPTNRISLAENIRPSDDEFTMPTQNRIGRHEGREFFEEFVPKRLPFDRQPPSLVIVQQYALLAGLLAKDLVFGSEILNDLLLLPIDPIRQNEDQQLPRLQNEIHRG